MPKKCRTCNKFANEICPKCNEFYCSTHKKDHICQKNEELHPLIVDTHPKEHDTNVLKKKCLTTSETVNETNNGLLKFENQLFALKLFLKYGHTLFQEILEFGFLMNMSSLFFKEILSYCVIRLLFFKDIFNFFGNFNFFDKIDLFTNTNQICKKIKIIATNNFTKLKVNSIFVLIMIVSTFIIFVLILGTVSFKIFYILQSYICLTIFVYVPKWILLPICHITSFQFLKNMKLKNRSFDKIFETMIDLWNCFIIPFALGDKQNQTIKVYEIIGVIFITIKNIT